MTADFYNSLAYVEKHAPIHTVLTHLAEEASELAAAALHYMRATTGVDPTPRSVAETHINLIEEIGDVLNCLDVLGINPSDTVLTQNREAKMIRWATRLRETTDESDD